MSIACSIISPDGNLKEIVNFPLELQSKRSKQSKAILGDIIKQIVDIAKYYKIPIIIEKLDFKKKKAALKEQSNKQARMLSSFFYNLFYQLLASRCNKEGIELIRVNPAYTSVIGEIKYARPYGLAIHDGAAIVIARRGLGRRLKEKLRNRSTRNAFPLPARNRGKHVWSDWSKVSKMLKEEKEESFLGRRSSEDNRRSKSLSSQHSGNQTGCAGRRQFPFKPGCDFQEQVGIGCCSGARYDL